MQTRFVEPDMIDCPIFDEMLDEILVVCSRCHSRSRIVPIVPHGDLRFAKRRFICEKCALVKHWSGDSLHWYWGHGIPTDPYFQLPLWLSITCCNSQLWFYNYRHMHLVEKYVEAELREKRKHPEYGWFNRSFFNRLPKFIKEAKHRDEILTAIKKLKHKT